MELANVKQRIDDIDEAAFEAEVPIMAEHESSTCQRCGASYDAAQFMALALPDGEGVWTFESATLAVRRCVCNKCIARRIS